MEIFSYAFLVSYAIYTFEHTVKLIGIYFVEKKFSAIKNQPLSAYLFNYTYVQLDHLLMMAIILPGLTYMYMLEINKYHAGYITLPMPTGNPFTITLCSVFYSFLYAFVWDFFQYWAHRAEHRIAFLWEIHKFHHSDQHLNASSAGREHFLSQIFRNVIIIFPMLILFKNFNLVAIYANIIFFRFWGNFNHSNLNLDLKWLTPILSGPQLHRIHHSNQFKHYDKNFAGLFPIYDILFGTYYHPVKHETPNTGLSDNEDLNHLWLAIMSPLVGWKKLLLARRTLTQ